MADAPTRSALIQRFSRLGLNLTIAGLSIAYVTGMGVFSAFTILSSDLPDLDRLWDTQRPPSVQIIDRQGREITVRGARALDPLPITDVPFHVRQAFIATEDRRFYAHAGLDPYSLSRAMYRNLQARAYVEGGSTLTQQLTKNVFLTREQTLKRKMQEAMLAIWLERRFSKTEILRLYLSRVYFGGGAYGLEAASDLYFGRPATELTLSEAAMLAGLLKAPSALHPVSNPTGAADRMGVVLTSMDRQELLADGVLEAALTSPVRVKRSTSDDPYEYFLDWIWPTVDPFIRDEGEDLVVQVSLDLTIQNAAHEAVTRRLDPSLGANQAAVVTLDDTGAVLSLIGGRSYAESQFNRATQAKRQPGSSFKPVVYLAAFRAGLSPWSERMDAPVTIDGWSPENFSETYRGPIRLEDALALSINTVTAALADEIGLPQVVTAAETLGVPDLDPFPSLALGAQGVSVLDMAGLYRVFSSNGERRPPYGLLSVSTATGRPLYDHQPSDVSVVMTDEELRLMNRLLTRVVDRGTGRAARIEGQDIAGKTGTTNDHRDAWFVGYSPGVTTAVWVGDDNNARMGRVTGGSIPARIFHDTMNAALAGRPRVRLPIADEPDFGRQQREFLSFLEQLDTSTTRINEPIPGRGTDQIPTSNQSPAPVQVPASIQLSIPASVNGDRG